MSTSTNPARSTDPAPLGREREVDGMLRAAANVAATRIDGALSVELQNLMWVYYNTPDAHHFKALALAILERAG